MSNLLVPSEATWAYVFIIVGEAQGEGTTTLIYRKKLQRMTMTEKIMLTQPSQDALTMLMYRAIANPTDNVADLKEAYVQYQDELNDSGFTVTYDQIQGEIVGWEAIKFGTHEPGWVTVFGYKDEDSSCGADEEDEDGDEDK